LRRAVSSAEDRARRKRYPRAPDIRIAIGHQLYAALVFGALLGVGAGMVLRSLGAYHKKEKIVLMVVINNIQLKRLEEIVFTKDSYALFIVENTFSVRPFRGGISIDRGG